MSKHYRPWKIDEAQLLPPRVQDYVPEKHLSRFIVALVRETLDLSEIEASYASVLGQPPFDPAMMTALLLNGYVSGIYSSRRIAKACTERADFMMIVAGDPPDFRTISDFRKRHLPALARLFLQVLLLCEAAGLVKLGDVAFDGTKIKANASKHKAMSYARMKKREAELQAEVDRWLAAEAALEDEAKAAAEEETRRRAEAEEKRKAEGRKRNGPPPAPPRAEPDSKAQIGALLAQPLLARGVALLGGLGEPANERLVDPLLMQGSKAAPAAAIRSGGNAGSELGVLVGERSVRTGKGMTRRCLR